MGAVILEGRRHYQLQYAKAEKEQGRNLLAFCPVAQRSCCCFTLANTSWMPGGHGDWVMAVYKFPRHRMGQRDWIWGLGQAKEVSIHLNLPTEQIFMSHQYHPMPFHL